MSVFFILACSNGALQASIFACRLHFIQIKSFALYDWIDSVNFSPVEVIK